MRLAGLLVGLGGGPGYSGGGADTCAFFYGEFVPNLLPIMNIEISIRVRPHDRSQRGVTLFPNINKSSFTHPMYTGENTNSKNQTTFIPASEIPKVFGLRAATECAAEIDST